MRSSASCFSWVNLTALCYLVIAYFSGRRMVLCNLHGPLRHRTIHNDDDRHPTFFSAETLPLVPDVRFTGINPTSRRGPQVHMEMRSIFHPGRQIRFPQEKQRCPSGSSCVNYRFCIKGVISKISPVLGSDSVKLSLEELREFGTPCSTSGNNVCCRGTLPTDTSGRQIEDEFFNLNIENLQCPSGFGCVNFRFCDTNAFISNFNSDLFGPSIQELLELGTRPCGSTGQELCCRRKSSLPPQQLGVNTLISVVNAAMNTSCPTGNICISYRFCNNGVISSTPTAGIEALGPEELMKFGTLCGNTGREVCCSRTPNSTQINSVPVILSPFPPSSALEEIPQFSIATISNGLVGCPADSSCINYRFCANGFIADLPSSFDATGPSLLDLAKFGSPCGAVEVCCKRVPKSQPTVTTVARVPVSPTTESPVLSSFEADSTTLFPEINRTCPIEMNCINYRWCANGVLTDFQSGFDVIGPTFGELQEFGRPCGRMEVCCQGTPSEETSSATEGNTIQTTERSSNISTQGTTPTLTPRTTVTFTETTRSPTSRPDLDLGTCPIGFNCINYQWCANGLVTEFKSSFDIIGPSFEELQEFGRPCGSLDVCCQGIPPLEPAPETEESTIQESERSTSLATQETTSMTTQISTTISTQRTTVTSTEATRSPTTRPKLDLGTCPVGFNCISYRWCANGVVTDFKSGFDLIGPSFEELQEFGRPCGNLEVCCQGNLPVETTSTETNINRTTETSTPPSMQTIILTSTKATKTTSTEKSRIPSTEISKNPSTRILLSISTVANTTRSMKATTTTPATVYTTSRKTKNSTSPNINQLVPAKHPKPVIFRPLNYIPKLQPSVTTAKPACSVHHYSNDGILSSPPKLVPQKTIINSNKPVGFNIPQDLKLTFENLYQGCTYDSYKCVPKEYCNLAGVTVNTPIYIQNSWQHYRPPLTSCWNSKIKQVGVCCRDAYRVNSLPGFQRPWPFPLMFRNFGYGKSYS